MTIDDKEIIRLWAFSNTATPGPWEVGDDPAEDAATLRARPCKHGGDPEDPVDVILPFGRAFSDARFIAAAREAVPKLLDEVERLRSQLPAGMEHCTVVFKQCDKGHGWLTATNWVWHGCPTCELDEARAACAAMREALTECREWIGHKERQRQEWPGGRPHLPIEIRAVEALATDIGKREAERITKLERLVSMLASAVKSSEPWSEVLEREMEGVGCAFTSTNSR